MKKLLVFLLSITLFTACKNDAKTEEQTVETETNSYNQNDGLVTMRGEFIYVAKDDAAVLQTSNEIYGVVVDDKMHELNNQLAEYKKEETDMVPVTVRVKRFESNDTNTWKYRVEIKEILKIEEPSENKDDVIKLGS
ncbi:hypothetical protein [Winogradskyella sp. 3972H.M.0a.05]|uniref:hypothetical protein n=1 Tax=Winogradskyella sp. 3972H.M.0a.05 TaxID=2950277 RepID=UPI003396678A